MKKIILFIGLGLFCLPAFAQNKLYFVAFKDRQNTPFSVDRPQEFLSQKSLQRRSRQNLKVQAWELPVNPNYVAEINKLGKVLHSTRWLNGVLVETTTENLAKIQQLTFVKTETITLQNRSPKDELGEEKQRKFDLEQPDNQVFAPKSSARTEADYGVSLTQIQQIGLDRMHEKGFRGEGMLVAVLDNGFTRANVLSHFQHLRIVDTYHFARRTPDVYGISESSHGVRVLSVLAAQKEGTLLGSAYKADYCLYKTEVDNAWDTRDEEFYWILGAERADSVGVDVLSSSLSYADFTNFNYQKSQLDGNTAWATQAADKASAVGMVVVLSASNDGATAWKLLRFPADADSALTVAAVNGEGKHGGFSSYGYKKNGRQKPDVAAFGVQTINLDALGGLTRANGTSFAAPLIAGLAAGLWQSYPQATNMQIVEAIRRSGSLYYTPNDSLGYGIPNFEKAQFLVTNTQNSALQNQIRVFPNPVSSQNLVLLVPENWKGEKLHLELLDLAGRKLWEEEKKVENMDNFLNFRDLTLSKGIYFLQIRTPFFQKTEKLVWEK